MIERQGIDELYNTETEMTNDSTTRPTVGSEEYAAVTGPATIRIERMLPGPIERVWSYLTDSAKRGTWLAEGEMEPRVGGRVEHIFRDNELTEDDDPPPDKYAHIADEFHMTGRIIVADAPHKLSYSWFDEFGESEVKFELTPVDDKVHLVLTHSRLTDRRQIVGAAGGWHVHLDILEARLAGRKPEGFWRSFNRLEGEYELRIEN